MNCLLLSLLSELWVYLYDGSILSISVLFCVNMSSSCDVFTCVLYLFTPQLFLYCFEMLPCGNVSNLFGSFAFFKMNLIVLFEMTNAANAVLYWLKITRTAKF
jgi:hypothetical protein